MNKIKLEYAMFVWSNDHNDYIIASKPCESELACRTRFAEQVNKKIFKDSVDINKTELRCRTVKSVRSKWRTIEPTEKIELLPSTEKVCLYVDMDGTLAKFNRLSTMEDLLSEGYFRNLEPLKNVLLAIKLLIESDELEVFSLSKYLTDSLYALHEKDEWLEEHLPELDKDHRIFVPYNRDKTEFIGELSETDLLLDDYFENLTKWHGVPIKLFNGINGTSNRGWDGHSTNYLFSPEKIAEDILQIARSLQKQQTLVLT